MPTRDPKLRRNLVISRQETNGEVFFVLKDPSREQFFRFREAEHFICQQLDGATPLGLIRKRAEERFGTPVEPETLEQFVRTLRGNGLLETNGHAQGRPAGRLRGSLLYLRLKAFDPERLLNSLIGKVRFFFTPFFVSFSAVLILLALGTAVLGWEEIGRDLPRLYRLDMLLWAWLLALGIVTLHEFAHGLTCKHFGGEVHEMGLMLLYFHPTLYCNVSDAWLFPEKSKRLWVTFAGVYFELFLWALSTLAWRMSDPDSELHFAALMVMTVTGAKTFFNINPLMKLDGYYLLSDYLAIPNLRQKSFRYIGAKIGRLWGAASGGAAGVTPRERRIYLAYGLLGFVYSSWVIGLITVGLGGFLVTNYDALGFFLFAYLFVMIVRKRFRRFFGGASGSSQLAPQAAAPRRPWRLALAAIAAAAVVSVVELDLRIAGDFRVLPMHNADVRAEVEGLIEEIYVQEGQWVRRGDLIARLSGRDFRAELLKTEAEMSARRANLKMLKAGTRPEEIEVARAAVAKAEERLAYGQTRLRMMRTAFSSDLVSRREFEQALEEDAIREKELEGTKKQLKLLLAGSRKEAIEAIAAEIDRLEAQQRYLEEQIRLLRLVSPITGMVTTPELKLKEKIGQLVKKGDLVAEVYELKTVMAQIAVPQREIAEVRVGQAVAVKARAYPHETFHGKVVSIATTASGAAPGGSGGGDSGGGPAAPPGTILVTTQIDNRSLLLKPEMTGKAKISAGDRTVFSLTVRRLARTFAVEVWSWW